MKTWLKQRALLLAGLLCLTLAAGQLLAESPWHDHGRHLADCALCHLQGIDAAPVDATPLPAEGQRSPAPVLAAQVAPVPAPFRLYASRAPPRRLSA